MGKLQSEMDTGGLALVKRHAMHITLQFLGERSAEEAEMVKKAIATVKLSRFRVSFVGLSYFSPDLVKVVFAKVEEGDGGLRGIYAKINNALLANGVAIPEGKLRASPHCREGEEGGEQEGAARLHRQQLVEGPRLVRGALDKPQGERPDSGRPGVQGPIRT